MISLLLLILFGAANTAYLHWQYIQRVKTGRKMFCLIGSHCEDVLSSRYGTTFGIKNELYGLAYYFGMFLLVIVTLLFPSYSYIFRVLLVLGALAASAFSCYLLILQAFVLRMFCSWCLVAIAINIAILITLLLTV